ncbi:MAG: DUF2975 domain-containing protein, partial [Sphingobacteriales bacterium]
MRSNLVRLANTVISLGFYLHFLYIPFLWFLMLSNYTSPDPVIVTRIEHGSVKGSEPLYNQELAPGRKFAIEEQRAEIYLRSDAILPYIFFFEAGIWSQGSAGALFPFFTMGLLWLLMKIFDSLRDGNVFTEQNARRIKWIGWILIARYFYSVAVSVTLGEYLETFKLPYEWARGISPDGLDLHLGILVLCIGLVYQNG